MKKVRVLSLMLTFVLMINAMSLAAFADDSVAVTTAIEEESSEETESLENVKETEVIGPETESETESETELETEPETESETKLENVDETKKLTQKKSKQNLKQLRRRNRKTN